MTGPDRTRDPALGAGAEAGVDEADPAAVREDAAQAVDDSALADAGLQPEGTTGDGVEAGDGDGAGGGRGSHRRPRRASLAYRLYNGEVGVDVVGRSRLIYRITAVVVLLCLVSMVFRGFNFGIDFAGGNSFQLPGTSSQLAAVQGAAEQAGAEVSTAQIVGGDAILLRTGQLDTAAERVVRAAIAEAAGVAPATVTFESVSAGWGRDITDQALLALAVFLVAVVLFLAVRFQPKMAAAAIIALVHDLVLTAGVYSLIGFEVSPSTVIGLLTILGFSLYDTVVVFDKVDENTRGLETGARMTWSEAANLAVNQTLMRSINTSVIALLPVAGLLFVGAGLLGVGTLKDLALVLFVGLAAGAYSSIFLATPILADLKEREPEQGALRKRVLARRSAAARQAAGRSAAGSRPGPGGRAPVASARRGGGKAGGPAAAVVELPAAVEADVVVESPSSVQAKSPRVESPRAESPRAATAAPRPGARPQRPGQRRSAGGGGAKKRR